MTAQKFTGKQCVVIFDDVTLRVKTREEIEKSEKKFRKLFTNMIIGVTINRIIGLDMGKSPRAIMVDVNPAFEILAGKNSAELVDRPISDTVPFCDMNIEEDLILAILQKQNHETEFHCTKSDKHFRINAFPIDEDQFVLTLQDISDQKREYLARKHLASIVASSEDAIYSVSLDAKILSWNRGAQEFYGYSPEEVLGHDVYILTPGMDRDSQLELIRKVAGGDTIKNLELVQRSKSGNDLPVFLTKSPIYDSPGNVMAISNIAKDISGIKEREEELIRAREKAESSGKLKTAFLQNVSHEIRTPMNSILGFTEILKKRIGDGQDQKYMRAIQESGNQLIRIIDDILDISRIDSNELDIHKTSFNLHKLLDRIRERFEMVMSGQDKSNIKLILRVPDEPEGACIYTDYVRLQQVLDNLLDNAVKYTDDGSIDFGYLRRDNNYLFFVKDTGRGIRKSHRGIIFNRFYRIDDKNTRVLTGTGLGLSICKGLVRMLGGSIWNDSEIGKGTTFYFTIPIEESDMPVAGQPTDKEWDEKAPDLKGKTILVAEDDEYSLQMMKIMLAETGAELLLAKDGNEALEMIGSYHIDLALLDIRLPKLNGFEILERIELAKHGIIPIAQTAYAMPEETRKILEAGFKEHLKKPISSGDLYKTLNKYFSPA
ncbi:MAG: PAS domain S-box protein [Bacteroidetes bacterium]|nr:MAG: PAS domain S-box protein [Bacteroidota bacterium]